MASVDISLAARLDVLDGMTRMLGDRMTALQRAMEAPPMQPFSFSNAQTGVVSGSNDLVLDMGGPTQGYVQDLRTLTIGGLTYATVAAGTALVVVSAITPLNAAAIGLAAVVDQAASLPLPAGYSRGQIRIKYPERLFVIVVGGTGSQAYVATGRFEEFQEAARAQVSAE